MTQVCTPKGASRLDIGGLVTVIGAGGHARVVVDLANRLPRQSVLGVIDSTATRPCVGRRIAGHEVRPQFTDLTEGEVRSASFVVAVGDAAVRSDLCAAVLAAGGNLPTLIYASANVAESARLAAGVVVGALAHIGPAARTGVGTTVNTAAVVEHDCVLGGSVHVAPRAALAGDVKVGERSSAGLGANVINGVWIGVDATIGAAAGAITDVPDGVTVVEVPARPVSRTRGEQLRLALQPPVTS